MANLSQLMDGPHDLRGLKLTAAMLAATEQAGPWLADHRKSAGPPRFRRHAGRIAKRKRKRARP